MEVDKLNQMLSMKEVSRQLGVPASTIRYWEKEFADYLEIARTDGNQRRYDVNAVATLSRIRDLIDTEMYTTEGARRQLAMQRDEAAALRRDLDPALLAREIDKVVAQASDELKGRLLSIYKK